MTRDEIVRESGGGMFAVIPAVVMRDTALPMSARMLYGLLTWKSNGEARCWPTNRTLAEELGLSQGRVSALLALLEDVRPEDAVVLSGGIWTHRDGGHSRRPDRAGGPAVHIPPDETNGGYP